MFALWTHLASDEVKGPRWHWELITSHVEDNGRDAPLSTQLDLGTVT